MHLFEVDKYLATPHLLLRTNQSEIKKALEDHQSGKWENEPDTVIRYNHKSIQDGDGLVMSDHVLSNMTIFIKTDLRTNQTVISEVAEEQEII